MTLTEVEKLEVIADTICRIDNATGPDAAVEGIPCPLHISVALRVLQAIAVAEEAKS